MTPSDFEPLQPLGGDMLRLRFAGTFAGAAVQWDATFMTLARYRRLHAPERGALHNLIEIGHAGSDGRQLLVALDVAAFDAATVVKTIIMVRNYKRLQLGRHWFGEQRRFA